VASEGEESGEEGCLSIPRLRGNVPRATRITVTGLDRSGRRLRIEAEDFLARVFQHEIDHLNGILFTERVVDKKSLHWLTEEDESERHVTAKRRRLRIDGKSNEGASPE
jgi:peptide deformylase